MGSIAASMSSALEWSAKWHIYDTVLPWSSVAYLAALHKAWDQILAKHFQDWWHLWRSAPRVHLPTHGGLRVSIWGEESLLIDTPVIRPKLYTGTDLTPICLEKMAGEGQHESSVKLLFFNCISLGEKHPVLPVVELISAVVSRHNKLDIRFHSQDMKCCCFESTHSISICTTQGDLKSTMHIQYCKFPLHL